MTRNIDTDTLTTIKFVRALTDPIVAHDAICAFHVHGRTTLVPYFPFSIRLVRVLMIRLFCLILYHLTLKRHPSVIFTCGPSHRKYLLVPGIEYVMRPRLVLLTLLVASGAMIAGCNTIQGGVTTTTDMSTGTVTTTSTPTTTTSTPTTTTSTPKEGDNLLAVSSVNNSTAMEVNQSKRANFSELDSDQQDVFLEAHNCSCNVNQNIFEFNDKDRIEYVKYEGQWYYLRVSAV